MARLLGGLMFATFIVFSSGKQNRFLKASNLVGSFEGGLRDIGMRRHNIQPITAISILADKMVPLADNVPADRTPQFLIDFVDSVKTFRAALEEAQFDESTQQESTEQTEEEEEEEEAETTTPFPADTAAQGISKRLLTQKRMDNPHVVIGLLQQMLGVMEKVADNEPADSSVHKEIQALKNALNVLENSTGKPDKLPKKEMVPEDELVPAGGQLATLPPAEPVANKKRALSRELRTLLKVLQQQN